MPRGKFTSANQKHYPDMGSNTSSVWNFCALFSDVISRGKEWWHREMSTVFSGYEFSFNVLINARQFHLFGKELNTLGQLFKRSLASV